VVVAAGVVAALLELECLFLISRKAPATETRLAPTVK
jgi:hypothetical protein